LEEDYRDMGAPNRDEVEGKYEQVKGSVKEGLGKVTGDDEMRSEGAADKLKGDVQEGWGGTKRKIGDMLDHAGDAVNK
jgi:uncharacterized protein YjbJ (UPF0337 family)